MTIRNPLLVLCWLGFWAAIGTGSWSIINPAPGFFGFITMLCALYLPFMMLACFIVLLVKATRISFNSVEVAMLLYGFIAFLIALLNPTFIAQNFFAAAFLAVIMFMVLACRVLYSDALLREINVGSWLASMMMLLTMLFTSRNFLFAPGLESGYGIVTSVMEMEGVLVSRSSGLSRLAAVLAIISFTFLVYSRRPTYKLAAALVFFSSGYLVYFMQSRGSAVSFVAAIFFVFLYGRKLSNSIFLLWVTIIVVGVSTLVVDYEPILKHLGRSQGLDGFSTMSGRPDIWSLAFDEILERPFFGYGFQADRILIGWNAQSAIIYAALSAGIIGALLFSYAVCRPLLSAYRVGKCLYLLPARDQFMVRLTSALLVFSLVRSIPENQAAVFSVDLLVQYPAMLFLLRSERKLPTQLILPYKFERHA